MDVNAVILRLLLKVALLRPHSKVSGSLIYGYFLGVFITFVVSIEHSSRSDPTCGSVADDTKEVSITMHSLSFTVLMSKVGAV